MSALIYCPFPDRDAARDVAATLIEERLIACANILGPIESLYVWEGVRGEAEEIAVLFKTDASALDNAIARLGVLHPYDTPAIIGWRCDATHPATAHWLASELGSGRRKA
ncbi:MAG: divalent cation transporter [Erythrobacter sp. RIFCSPHIGHO2_12_FULL_63_10]|nr:MAG: divalent cation transporter [Erythrobacter sp. RIFCSPHIGHO2_12_FULL_63_10]